MPHDNTQLPVLKPKGYVVILALCCCVALTAATPTARADDDAKAKDKIILPAFHKQTIKIGGKDVPIEVRWFDKPFVVGATNIKTLPASATKTFIATQQDLLNKKYNVYVGKFVDTKQAEKIVEYAQSQPENELQEHFKRVSNTRVNGEIRVGAYDMIIRFVFDEQEKIGVRYLLRKDGSFQMIAVPYYRREEMSQQIAVSQLVESKELSPEMNTE